MQLTKEYQLRFKCLGDSIIWHGMENVRKCCSKYVQGTAEKSELDGSSCSLKLDMSSVLQVSIKMLLGALFTVSTLILMASHKVIGP